MENGGDSLNEIEDFILDKKSKNPVHAKSPLHLHTKSPNKPIEPLSPHKPIEPPKRIKSKTPKSKSVPKDISGGI